MDQPGDAPKPRRRIWRRLLLAALLVPLLLAGAALAALRTAAEQLRVQVLEALGPESSVGVIELSWPAVVVVHDLSIRGPRGWPRKDALRAERIELVPDLRALMSGEIRIARIRVKAPYLSALRTKEGKLRLLPSLLERSRTRARNSPAPVVTINHTTLHQAAVDFIDASIADPPHALRLEKLDLDVGEIVLPALTSRTTLKLTGVVRGPVDNGTVEIEGWARFATHDSELQSYLDDIDLVTLQPYLLQASETGVEKGILDLSLQSEVSGDHLHAPGKLTLAGLELKPGGSTFMGMSRNSLIAGFKDRHQRITVKFVLDGDLGSPGFSLNESLKGRASLAVAKTLGLSIAGVGTATWGAVKGIGKSIGGLFSKDEEPPPDPAAESKR